MNFSVNTVYTKERLLEFHSFMMRRKLVLWIIMLISTVLVTAAFILTLPLGMDTTVTVAFIGVIVLDALYITFSVIIPRISVRKAKSLNASIELEFEDSFFKITAEASGLQSREQINYSVINKIMSDSNNLYLFLDTAHAFILDRKGFNVGDADGLVAFLVGKGIKYKR